MIFFQVLLKYNSFFLKPKIWKRGTECEDFRKSRGTFIMNLGSLLENSEECYNFNIPENVPKDYGCPKSLLIMF